jgi:hypothetical protein
MSNEAPAAAPTNRSAIVSLISGLLTALSFCTAVAPVPFTGYFCYPSAALFGVVAMIYGIRALIQIRRTGEDGRTYALVGIWVGGLAVAATMCSVTLGILLFPRAIALIHQYLK